MNRSYREPIESDFIISINDNENVSELEDDSTDEPTVEATVQPTVQPTVEATVEPTVEATVQPTVECFSIVTENTQFTEKPIVENIMEDIIKNIGEPTPQKITVFAEAILEKSPKVPIIVTKFDNYIKALDPALSKLAYYLTPPEFIIIQQFVNDPNTIVISQIKQCVQNIMTEEVIQLHDIPKFILSISQIFTTNFITVKNINITNIIKYTLDSLMEYNVLEFKGDRKISKSLIETSFNLLQTSILKNKSKKLFSSFFSCFK